MLKTLIADMLYMQILFGALFSPQAAGQSGISEKGGTSHAVEEPPSVHEGWPLKYEGDFFSEYQVSHMTIARDNCTGKTVIAYVHVGKLYVVDDTGRIFHGWPVDVTDIVGGVPELFKPILGDIDGDRKLEVCAMAPNYVFAWNLEDASLVEGWPVYFIQGKVREICLADLDNDNVLELVAVREPEGYESFLFVFHGDGTLLDGWPVMCFDPYFGEEVPFLAVADLDMDGTTEIILSLGYILGDISPVYAYTPNGDLKWTAAIPKTTAAMALGDIDGQKGLEVVLYSNINDNEGCISVLNSDGVFLPGWKFVPWYEVSDMALGDLDLDGSPNVVLYGGYKAGPHSFRTFIVAFDSKGSIIWKYEINPILNVSSRNLLIGDFVQDAHPEILFCTTSPEPAGPPQRSWLIGLDHDRKTAFDLPVPDGFVGENGCLGDIDQDGKVEVLYWTWSQIQRERSKTDLFRLYLWDLNYAYDEATMEWPMYCHDCRHSSCHH